MLVTSSGGPTRSEKMDSSNNLTPLIFGPEPVVITTLDGLLTSTVSSYRSVLIFSLFLLVFCLVYGFVPQIKLASGRLSSARQNSWPYLTVSFIAAVT